MPEMTSAPAAMDLCANQEEVAALLRCFDCALDRSPEARPTRPTFEFGARREHRQIAPSTYVGTRPVFLIERARPGPLGRAPPEHGVLLVGKRTTPFLV